jgi:glycosyltransferase involved in cell wall biosynthesis
VFDFDDAIFEGRGTRAKFPRLIALADRVVAGNDYLAEAAGAPEKTTVIPTAVDTARFAAQPARDRSGAGVVVGWTGLSSNYRHLAIAAPAIARALRRTGATFLAISDAPPPSSLAELRAEFVRWRPETEVDDLAGIDVGLMPLPDGRYERGKCAYKLIQHMALARPVVGSPVGANRTVVTDGVDGVLATDAAAWEDALVRLITDPDLRLQMGQRARARVEAAYSLNAVVPRYRQIFEELGAR